MQWFSSGSGPSSSAAASSSQPSLLADWNSYAAARSAEDAGDGFGIDIEAAVRSANDRVAGTFGVYVHGNPHALRPSSLFLLLGQRSVSSYYLRNRIVPSLVLLAILLHNRRDRSRRQFPDRLRAESVCWRFSS